MNNNINFNNEFNKISGGFSIPNVIKMPSKTVVQTEEKKPAQQVVSEQNKNDNTTQTAINIQQKPDVVEISTENSQGKEPKGKKPLGKIVFISMLAAGAAVLLLTKGISGSTASKIRRWADKWEDNFLRYACKNKTMDKLDEKIVKTSQKVNKLFSFSDSIANFTAIKDTLFHQFTSWDFLNNKSNNKILKHLRFPKLQKFLQKWVPLQKLCDFSTKKVLKISVGAVDSKYAKVSSSLENLEASLKEVIGNSSEKLTPAQKQKLEKLVNSITPTYKKGFDKSARNQRLSFIHKSLSDLAQKVKDGLTAPFVQKRNKFGKIYSSYVTKTLSAPAQKVHTKAINSAKIALSNDISDVYLNLRNTANELKHCLAPEDKFSRLMLGEILESLEKYRGFSGSKELVNRQAIQKQILSALGEIMNIQKAQKQSSETAKKIAGLVTSMKSTISQSSKKGLLQDILSEIKGVVPEKQYKQLRTQTQTVNELLNEATDSEANNLFNKIAESKVGSIPTDMLGLATMAGTGAWAITKGKDKEEKVGATLKVGVPLLGGIASYFYTASKAFSGTKNLLFGILTTIVLNKLGGSVFNYYQKRYVENKSVQEIAEDAYNNAVSS